MSLLQVQGLRKSYGERLLFDIPQFALERGRGYILTGSNGVGKTTLLRILAGLEPAEMASFHFDGRAVAAPEIVSLAPAVIYMHQHPYLFHSSVAANVAYGLKGTGLSHGAIAYRVEQEIAWAGLQEVAHVPPSRLSGGERQKVALARARILKPRLLLLDEPTANLDVAARRQVVELIARMGDDDNCVLVATHDRELIERAWAARYVLQGLALQTL